METKNVLCYTISFVRKTCHLKHYVHLNLDFKSFCGLVRSNMKKANNNNNNQNDLEIMLVITKLLRQYNQTTIKCTPILTIYVALNHICIFNVSQIYT